MRCALGADDLAAVRVDECLEALAKICRLVQPAVQQTADDVADAIADIVRQLGFIAEREEARARLDVAAFFTRPRVKIPGIRQVDDEAALLGHVYIFGVMHHVWFVRVEEQDGDQVAVDDPYDRLEELQQLDADAGRFQTVEVPGFPGEYVLVIYPAGAEHPFLSQKIEGWLGLITGIRSMMSRRSRFPGTGSALYKAALRRGDEDLNPIDRRRS